MPLVLCGAPGSGVRKRGRPPLAGRQRVEPAAQHPRDQL